MDNKQILQNLKERESELLQLVEQWKNAQKELAGTQKAIKALEEISPDTNGQSKKNNDSNGYAKILYSPEFTWREKIEAALTNIRKGQVQDIVSYIVNMEPDEDKDKIYRNVNSTVFLLSKKKLISSRKVGGKKIYRNKDV